MGLVCSRARASDIYIRSFKYTHYTFYKIRLDNAKRLDRSCHPISGTDMKEMPASDRLARQTTTQRSRYANFCVYCASKIMRKIMEAIRTAYAKKKTGLGLNTSQTRHDANDHGTYTSVWKESAHGLRNIFHFAECLMNLLVKVQWKSGIRFSISFRWYAFPNFCTQISRPLAYGVRIFSKVSATADHTSPSIFMVSLGYQYIPKGFCQESPAVLTGTRTDRFEATVSNFSVWHSPIILQNISNCGYETKVTN